MILTFYRFLPLGNAILSNLAKNTGSSDVEGDRKVRNDRGNSARSRIYYQTIIIFKVRKKKVFKNKPCQEADKKDFKYFASLIFLFWLLHLCSVPRFLSPTAWERGCLQNR